jgi:hypothetical protein
LILISDFDATFGAVFQTLTYTARLRLPGDWTVEQKIEKVNDIIDVLNLGKARNTLIGSPFQPGVSGGWNFTESFSSFLVNF